MKDTIITSEVLSRLIQSTESESTVHQQFSGVNAWTINLHEDVYNWLVDSSSAVDQRKRSLYILTRFRIDGYMSGHKPVKGKAAGWWRARLGGTAGSHFYMWYTNGTTDLGKSLGLDQREVLVREIRHHDEISEPPTVSSRSEWMPIEPKDLVISDEIRPYTSEQYRIALDKGTPVLIIKGYPGSGKTTTLQLAASFANAERVLYITFSQRLATEASKFFNAYQRDGLSIDVMSFAELIDAVSDSPTGATGFPSVNELADLFMSSITPHVARQFGTWTNHLDELYAELHAHAIGRSLPIDFREVKESSDLFLSPENYEKLRRKEGLGDAAKDAAEILKEISESKLLNEIFPSASAARAAISEIYRPLPNRFSKIGMVLIDEVQDLTPIEYFFVLNVVSRIAVDNKKWPKLLIAGDESQTVRPTEFEWAWMKELTTTVFENVRFNEEVLPSNLRAPLAVAEFVEATRAQYSLLPKVERPSGLSATELNDSENGTVKYCLLNTEESVNDLLEIAESLPQSVVIYPGFRLPKELEDKEDEGRIWTSLEAKGLDFENVFVLDAGKNQEHLRQQLANVKQSEFVNVWARSSADNFRVACSRSSKNLVLIDRDGIDKSDYIRQLFVRQSVDTFEECDLSDLHELNEESSDPLDKLERVLKDVDALIETNTNRALKRARTASRQLEKLSTEQNVPLDLVERVHLSRGSVADYWTSRSNSELDSNFRAVQEEARICFSQTDISSAYETYRDLREQLNSKAHDYGVLHKKSLDLLTSALACHNQLERKANFIARSNENLILNWINQLASVDPGLNDHGTLVRSLQFQESVILEFGSRHPYLIEQSESVLTTWVNQYRSKRKAKDALQLLSISSNANSQLHGLCLEDLAQYSQAIEIFEASGYTEDAIRCSRRMGDFDKARELNGGKDPELDQYLAWISSVTSTLAQGSATSFEMLKEEKRLIENLVEDYDPIVEADPDYTFFSDPDPF
jgi:hypothetical protein